MAERPLFSIPAASLDVAGQTFDKPMPLAWLTAAFADSEARPVADGEVNVRLSKSGTDVVVHGHAKAEVEVPCARCLDPVRVTLAPQISVLMVPLARMRKEERELELSGSEADVLPFDGENVVLDDLLRDELVLDVPMIPLCSESCPGIASGEAQRASERVVDPRLAPLLALKNKNQKE